MQTRLTIPSEEARETLKERRWPEDSPAFRSGAQRDRDRVLYSSAFQRLAGITQVSAAEPGHTLHTRLTHSLKVAQVARRLTERLQVEFQSGDTSQLIAALNADAAEAAALAHDLGHPPFGHLAEKQLDDLAAEFGGFEGNAQSFRVITRLALRSSDQPGLNLTRRTLAGTLKYPWLRDPEDADRDDHWAAYASDRQYFEWVRQGAEGVERSLEAEIVDWADDVTYAVHDMDDFYRAGLVPLDRLWSSDEELGNFQAFLVERDADRGAALRDAAERLFRGLLRINSRYEGRAEERINLRTLGSGLITRYINAVELGSGGNGEASFEIDDAIRDEVAALKQLTWFYVIERPSLAIVQSGQRRIIEELFKRYSDAAEKSNLSLFPVPFAERLRQAETPASQGRVITDLIAGMTESAAIHVYRRMNGIISGSILDPAGRIV